MRENGGWDNVQVPQLNANGKNELHTIERQCVEDLGAALHTQGRTNKDQGAAVLSKRQTKINDRVKKYTVVLYYKIYHQEDTAER